MAGIWEVILRWNAADVFAESDKEPEVYWQGPFISSLNLISDTRVDVMFVWLCRFPNTGSLIDYKHCW